MDVKGMWIRPEGQPEDICPVFETSFVLEAKPIREAVLCVTAIGVYEAVLNGKRVGEFVFAPGWTSYEKRLQVQTYEVKELLQKGGRKEDGAENGREPEVLQITVGKGWYRSPMPGWISEEHRREKASLPAAVLAWLEIRYADGTVQTVATDLNWRWKESPIRFSEIYDGERYDARLEELGSAKAYPVKAAELSYAHLIPQQGEEIREQERVAAKRIFRTPKGEVVVDFGQEVTGYVEFTAEAGAGEPVEITHGEVLDAEGNFYRDNYRGAKAKIRYTCKAGAQTWHPKLTFYGFRYIRLDAFPGLELWEENIRPAQFTAIAVYSDLKQTGEIRTSNPLLNRLFSNVLWGQRGNFVDVPTDCPQRDERLGWTGDAQAFVKTASYNYDVERFFTKWLEDLALDQRADGSVCHVIPAVCDVGSGSAAWDDAAVICPWQIYLTYGNPAILRQQYDSMNRYLSYIEGSTAEPHLWIGGEHYGDWLGLDSPEDSYKGASDPDFIASAFYAHSLELTVKAGRVLKEDVSDLEERYRLAKDAFQRRFPVYRTQTEHVLAVHFQLAPEPSQTAAALAKLVEEDGCRLRTGFVGTPYLLHVLSSYGYTELAYTLLLRTEYPSWLYPVTKGATTVWEHWDGIKEDGSFWSTDMNSFNHYAYGAVTDWIYEEAAGIHTVEEAPGFARIRIEPRPDARLNWLEASIETRQGRVSSKWTHTEDGVRYEITTPSETEIRIEGKTYLVNKGSYVF